MQSFQPLRYGDDLTFYNIAPARTPSTPLPKMALMSKMSNKEKMSALPVPLIVDNSVDTYLTAEKDFVLSDNSLDEKQNSFVNKREENYVLPILHHRPKIRSFLLRTIV